MKASITVVIPVWNLQKRGLDRVFWSLYSLKSQTIPVKAVVYDASTTGKPQNFSDQATKHIRRKYPRLNIAYMMNRGIEEADTEFIATTGADFLFKPDFFETALEFAKPGTAVFCEVDEMIRSMRLSTGFIDNWEFDKVPQLLRRNLGPVNNTGKTHAPGAINLLHRSDWIKSGGYNENFQMWGGYDNEFCQHLHQIGIKAKWIHNRTQCIHQYHRIEKERLGKDKKHWDANQRLYNKVKRNGREPGENWLNLEMMDATV